MNLQTTLTLKRWLCRARSPLPSPNGISLPIPHHKPFLGQVQCEDGPCRPRKEGRGSRSAGGAAGRGWAGELPGGPPGSNASFGENVNATGGLRSTQRLDTRKVGSRDPAGLSAPGKQPRAASGKTFSCVLRRDTRFCEKVSDGEGGSPGTHLCLALTFSCRRANTRGSIRWFIGGCLVSPF